MIDWLRRAKPDLEISGTSMAQIRRVLAAVDDVGGRLKSESVKVWVESTGDVVIELEGKAFTPLGGQHLQGLVDIGFLNPIAAYQSGLGLSGPDLAVPRPTLRIIPGKLSGEPHVRNTRVGTESLRALARREMSDEVILSLYPALSLENVREAIDLEEQLERNLGVRAA